MKQEHKVSIIITAYNESARISEKISNTIALDYPPDLLEIIVASDGSDDGTDEIVSGFQEVRLVVVPGRVGKEATQDAAVKTSVGEITVFTDVATILEKDALRRISAQFTVLEVGALSSEDRFIVADGKVSGEGVYVRYEMALRKLEGTFNTLVGLSGSFFACRRQVCHDWNNSIPSDFGTALRCAKQGLRAIPAPGLYGYYKDVSDPKKEYNRKVRTILRGINGLRSEPRALNPMENGWFALQLWSHKVLRWSGPLLLAGALIGSLLLALDSTFGRVILAIQLAFYSIAMFPSQFVPGYLRLPKYFVMTNLAIGHALILSFRGVNKVAWQPSQR
ncbi:MAG: glycosyltransferase [Pseudomonadales bacterium]|nr:glycosyltransferase [Pseudomonadales bacterium]